MSFKLEKPSVAISLRLNHRLPGLQQVVSALEERTGALYGYVRVKQEDQIRPLMLKKMVGEGESIKHTSKVNLAKLPP